MARSQQGRMVSAALRHPIRVRALEAMNLGVEVSATLFVNEGMGRGIDELRGRTYQQQVADVSYHLRQLEKADCVEVSRKEPRRGAWETFYRAKAVAYFSDEEWADLERDERRPITRVVAQGFIVQMEGAIMADTFDSRVDRWLLYEPLKLDEQGWGDLRDAIATFYDEVKEIRDASGERLEAAGEDASPIRTTFGVASFESPELLDFGIAPGYIDAPDDPEADPGSSGT